MNTGASEFFPGIAMRVSFAFHFICMGYSIIIQSIMKTHNLDVLLMVDLVLIKLNFT